MSTAFVKDDVFKLKEPACKPIVQKQEIHMMADLTKPVALINKPSMFASGKLEVTISDGLLTSLNSENTPLTAELLGNIGRDRHGCGGAFVLAIESKVGEGETAPPPAPQIKKIEDLAGSQRPASKDACSSR